ncbi:MAG: ABC transporter ATP-binding protein [Planctomycetota bacterium]
MDAAIRTEGLGKSYGGTPGILDLDLEVRPGEVFGFLGPNGAGKSTTIRLLLAYLRPDRGRAAVLGLDAWREAVAIRRRLGYLPADLALWPKPTGRQLLTLLAGLRGLPDLGRAEPLAERLGLDLDKRAGDLSSGNRQKLGIVQAFFHAPELLILDEPTSGLDPLVQAEFCRIVDEERERGRTVFLSTHVLPEAERLCDRVGIVRASRLVTVESVHALRAKALRRVELRFGGEVLPAPFEGLQGVHRVERLGPQELGLDVAGPLSEVLAVASRHHVLDVVAREADLEEVFLRHYDGRGAGSP